MNLENMSIIFLLLIIPISMILETYTQTRIETISLQSQYDAKLNNSTYDAIKAYQLNSFTNSEGSLTNSKMRDIKASVNSFFTSLGNNFSTIGYTRDTLEAYVPAIVYTMYDGYYIYAPYTNTWSVNGENMAEKTDGNGNKTGDEITIKDPDKFTIPYQSSDTYSDDQDLYGIRPYIYYSARYKDNSGYNDVVITYSLDNYISIIGTLKGKYAQKSGYLLSNVSSNSYNGRTINSESIQSENVRVDGETHYYPCIKINGTKYYKADSGDIFYITNGKAVVQKNGVGYDAFYGSPENKDPKTSDDRAINYYNDAIDMKNFILSHDFLKNLTCADMVDDNGTNFNSADDSFKNSFTKLTSNKGIIFDFDHSGGIEAADSNFNTYRLDVIKYKIESNLSVAITNYNRYSDAGNSTNFQMPKLKDTDWDKITNNIGIITFLQGIGIGGKIYNGYSVVTNTKNSDVVSEDSIYILSRNDNKLHNVAETGLSISGADRGVFNVDCERRTISTLNSDSPNITSYYYPIEAQYSYESIVTQDKVGDRKKILEKNKQLATLYYTALGRERYSLYRTQ